MNVAGVNDNNDSDTNAVTSIISTISSVSVRQAANSEARGAAETVAAASTTALFAATTKITKTAATAFSKSNDRLPALSQLSSYTHQIITLLFFSLFFINVLLLFLWVPLVLDVVFQHKPTSFFRSGRGWGYSRRTDQQEEQEEYLWDDGRFKDAIVQCVWAEKENTAAAA